MRRNTKIVLIGFLSLVIIWTGFRVLGLKFYRIPTASMENTIPVGARVMVWKKNFTPERFEIIIYHNPDFDTILIPHNPMGYYAAKRQFGSEVINSQFQKVYIPLSKREQWLGRCVGLPGDNIRIKNGELYINGELYANKNTKKMYLIKTIDNNPINKNIFEQNFINPENAYKQIDSYIIPITKSQVENILQSIKVDTSYYIIENMDKFDNMIFPYDSVFAWNRDFFGELEIPQEGKIIKLTIENISIYKRLIEAFEGNTLSIQDSSIFINGKIVDSYTPKNDYYFICNDNRDNSLDSRYYGFLPNDHISGKVLKIFKE